MPLYDFECPHGHTFEHQCLIKDRDNEIKCEGTVNQLIVDDDVVAFHTDHPDAPLGDDMEWVELEFELIPNAPKDSKPPAKEKTLVRKVPCLLKAKKIISHSFPGSMLDHGSCNNREAALAGKYDPDRPSTRGMTKGRNWMKR